MLRQVNASNPAASRAIVDLFADVMDLSRDRSRLDMYLCRKALTPRKAPSPRCPWACRAAACVGVVLRWSQGLCWLY